MYSICNNQTPGSYFVILNTNYYKKIFIFFIIVFFPNFFTLNMSPLSYCIYIFYNLFLIFLGIFCSDNIIFF